MEDERPNRNPKGRYETECLLCLLGLLCGAFLLFLGFAIGAGIWNLLLPALLFFSLYVFAKQLLFACLSDRKETETLAEDDRSKQKVLIAVSAVLTGGEEDAAVFDRLEALYHTNRTGNTVFAAICDLLPSKRRTAEEDAVVISRAREKTEALSAKYEKQFALFVRGRRLSEREKCYTAWEDERGRLYEFCRFLNGKDAKFVYYSDISRLSDVKYLLITDTKTRFCADAARTFLRETASLGQTLILPKCLPEISSENRFVVFLRAAEEASLQQMLLDEKGFDGVGFLDIHAYLRVCDDFFEENQTLPSRFLLGEFLHAKRSKRVFARKSLPRNAIEYEMGRRVQIREILWELAALFRNSNRKRLDFFSKIKLFDRFFAVCTPITVAISVLLSSFFSQKTMLLTVLTVLSPMIFLLLRGLFCVKREGFQSISHACRAVFFQLISLGLEAVLLVEAAFDCLIKRKIFSQTPAQRVNGYLDAHLLWFSPSMMLGLLLFCAHGVTVKVIGALWMLAPFFLWFLARERKLRLCASDRETLIRYAHDTWLFFRDYVSEKTKGLPPISVQFSPNASEKKLTSPSAIGFYLLSLLAAHDLGFIGRDELYRRGLQTMQTVSSLFKWHGNLFSRYTLVGTVEEGYVSTAESGIFVSALLAFSEGCGEYIAEDMRFSTLSELARTLISETELSALYDGECELFYEGYSVQNGKFSEEHYENQISEAMLASFFAMASGSVPFTHAKKLRQTVVGSAFVRGLACDTGTASSYFLPSLFLPTEKESFFGRAKTYAYRKQRKRRAKNGLFGKSESGYFAFDGAMSYQKRPFGIASLAEKACFDEPVIAPYASFLMLSEAPETLTENLKRLEAFGMYGKYGFFEALDLTCSRVGTGYAVIRRICAEHAGISMVCVADLLRGGIFQKRFLRSSAMRASMILWDEPMPQGPVCHLPKRRPPKDMPFSRVSSEPPTKCFAHTLLHPDMAMLSNNKTKLFLSSSGHIALENGRTRLLASDFDLYSVRRGMRISVCIDGVMLPTAKLMREAEGISSRFLYESDAYSVSYRAFHTNGGRTWETCVRFAVCADQEGCTASVFVKGDFARAYAVLTCEPLPFENETLHAAFHAEEGVLMLAKKERFFGIAAYPSAGAGCFEETSGCVTLKSGEILPKKGKILFRFGMSEDAEDLLYELAGEDRTRRHLHIGALLALQYRAAGLFSSPLAAEHAILRALFFGEIRPRLEGTRHLSREAFSRFEGSWDEPIVLADGFSDKAEPRRNLRELLGVFQYMSVRGVRFALVVFYRGKEQEAAVFEEIKRAGAEPFLSVSFGIFPVDCDALDVGERFVYMLYAVSIFDLSRQVAEQANENGRLVMLSPAVERHLKEAPTGACSLEEVLWKSERDFLPLARLKLLLRIYEGGHAYKDYRLRGTAARGEIQGIHFEVSVSDLEMLQGKKAEITLESEKRMRISLIFCLEPLLGEKADARFYRFVREKHAVRVTRFSEHSLPELILFSPEDAVFFTDEAALRSDGAVFRGESDVAASALQMELAGKRRCRFYLSAFFSEAEYRLFCEYLAESDAFGEENGISL